MDILLDPVEARILGALLEKEMTTPDYYPLTLNALASACNQKSNRLPVMSLDEDTLTRAIDTLKKKQMIWQVRMAGSRALKYEHNMKRFEDISKREAAILCVLLLRGPQTVGEIRTRCGRMYEFNGLSEVERSINNLMEREEGAFTVKLPLSPGHKEFRYTHLLCGEVNIDEEQDAPVYSTEPLEIRYQDSNITELEQRVVNLETELDSLKIQFAEFIKQFE
ncbi:YceH family protein [Desulfobacterales bacterium HSG17]|nr:YceH family protein [Desulfobacterales bacterium HSG17]